MDGTFSWQRFDRIARVLEALGYVVAFFGPLAGIVMFVIGDWITRIVGLSLIFASFLIAAYHISFSLLMNAVHDLTKKLEESKSSERA
jgi:hypothetical protein